MSKKILYVIDPGHVDGYNKGVAQGYSEGTKMYTLATYQKKYLEQYGIDVIITRKNVKDKEPKKARNKSRDRNTQQNRFFHSV